MDNPPLPSPAAPTPRLALRGISKRYPTIVANDKVDLTVMAGEIHAVLGENGAGKSTLMKIIYGISHPDEGEIYWQGEKVVIGNPHQARTLGIGMVFQHFSLFETLSVVENVALALSGRHSLPDLSQKITAVSEKYGLPVSPQRIGHSLSVGERQRVEIVRCLLQNPRLLIMDEPTSVLTPQAVSTLFKTLQQLAQEGCSILYISHKLDEIQALCHTATILRAGKVTGTCTPAQETPQSMARMMIGKDLPQCQHSHSASDGAVCLKLAGLSLTSADQFGTDLQDVHLDVRAGEIVGIAGVSGNGQQELLAAISGEAPITEKHPIQLCGVEVGRLSAAERRDLGMAFVPEERLGRGAVPKMTLVENALLTTARTMKFLWHGLIDTKKVTAFSHDNIRSFDVHCSGVQATAASLSGGNLQKFIVGREILQKPKVLVVAQPTWGVDVGAAAFIHQSLIDLRNEGCAILVISEELSELFEICDYLAVMAKGRLSPTKATRDTHVEEIGMWMSGLWPNAESPPRDRLHV